MAVSLSERQLAGRIGGHRSWARTSDRTARTANARANGPGQLSYHYDEVDPDRVLDPEERDRRAQHARKAWFAELALKSAKARRKASAVADEASTPGAVAS